MALVVACAAALLLANFSTVACGYDGVATHVVRQWRRLRALQAQGVPCTALSLPWGDLPFFTAARAAGGDAWLQLHAFPARDKRGVVGYWFGVELRVIVYDQALYLDAFSAAQSLRFHKSVSLRHIFGSDNVIVADDGDEHRLYRALTRRIRDGSSFVDAFAQSTRAALQAVADDAVTDAHALVGHLTLATVGRLALGSDAFEDAALATSMLGSLTWLLDNISGNNLSGLAFLPLAHLHPSMWGRAAHVANVRGALQRIIDERVCSRRAGGGDNGTLLDDLISAHLEAPQRLTLQQLYSNAMVLTFAGHEMTTNSITWALYFLALHADVQAEARLEVQAMLRSTPAGGAFTKEALPLVSAVLVESMRLIPSVGFLSRVAAEDVTLCAGQEKELRLPRGTVMTVSNYSIHRDVAIYGPDAGAFNPKRFLPPRALAYPRALFGTGPRSCVGQGYAEAQMRAVLATILSRTEWTLDASYRHHPLHAVTTRPKYGMPLRMRSIVP